MAVREHPGAGVSSGRRDDLADVGAVLDAFDRAFAAGDADAMRPLYADDAVLLLVFSDPVAGPDAIHDAWARGFDRWDTSAWRTRRERIEVEGSLAQTLTTYTETLVPRDPSERTRHLVDGRYVALLRRGADASWRITLQMNSHRRPIEEVEEPEEA